MYARGSGRHDWLTTLRRCILVNWLSCKISNRPFDNKAGSHTSSSAVVAEMMPIHDIPWPCAHHHSWWRLRQVRCGKVSTSLPTAWTTSSSAGGWAYMLNHLTSVHIWHRSWTSSLTHTLGSLNTYMLMLWWHPLSASVAWLSSHCDLFWAIRMISFRPLFPSQNLQCTQTLYQEISPRTR